MISLNLGMIGIKPLQREIMSFVVSVFERHDLSKAETPAELDDKTPRFIKTRDGRRISTLLLPEDMAAGFASPAGALLEQSWSLAWAAAAILGVLISPWAGLAILAIWTLLDSFLSFKLRFDWLTLSAASQKHMVLAIVEIIFRVCVLVGGFSIPLLWMIPSAFSVVQSIKDFIAFEASLRGKLQLQGRVFAAESNPTFERLLDAHIPAREIQRKAVLADHSPVYEIGTATGTLTDVGDGYAPDRGMSLNISAGTDLSTSLWCFGETGSGKTSGLLRKVAKWWIKEKQGGLAVFDGKGDLPVELSSLPGFTLIAPGAASYGLIAGLKAEDVATVIASTMNKNENKSEFWSSSGQTLLRQAAVLLEAASESNPMDYPWTLNTLRQVINEQGFQQAAIKEVKGSGKFAETSGEATLIGGAVRYFEAELATMATDTKSGIVATADSWLSPIIGHRDLFDWANSAEGVDPTKVCEGAIIGVGTPEYKFGVAGVAVQALIKARIYRAIKQRGSGWSKVEGQTPVLILADEAQELIGETEMAMTAISRSLGLRFVMASQHLEGIIAKFGGKEDAAKAMLKNFRSMVCFASSPKTIEYVTERMGSILRRTPQASPGSIAYGHVAKQVIESASLSGVNDANSGFMKTMSRRGVIPLQVSSRVYNAKTGMMADFDQLASSPSILQANYQCEIDRVLTPAEAEVFLKTPFTAIVEVMRGGVPRRDIVEITPEFA